MRKQLLSTLLLGTITLGMVAPALAENFTYKVYNPKANKAYTAVLGTITVVDNKYIFAFLTKSGQPLCVMGGNTNIKNGLVGGQCSEFNAFGRLLNGENINLDRYQYGWREYSTDTIEREMASIRKERAAQGKYQY